MDEQEEQTNKPVVSIEDLTTQVEGSLSEIMQMRTEVSRLRGKKADEIDMVIPEEIKNLIRGIAEFYNAEIDPMERRITDLENEARDLVMQIGATVVGNPFDGHYIQAVYTPAGFTWDKKKLEGYAAARPELQKFKKATKPFVAIKESMFKPDDVKS